MTDPFGGPLDSFALALEDKSSQTLDNYSRAVLASWLYITVDHDKQVALVRGPAAEWAVYVISPADFTWAPNLVAVRRLGDPRHRSSRPRRPRSGLPRARRRHRTEDAGAMTYQKTGTEFWDECAMVGPTDAAVRTHAEAIGWLYRIESDDLRIPKQLVRRFAGSSEWDR
jgi:hypothetical protein